MIKLEKISTQKRGYYGADQDHWYLQLDFSNDWHEALQFSANASPDEVGKALIELGHRIRHEPNLKEANATQAPVTR